MPEKPVYEHIEELFQAFPRGANPQRTKVYIERLKDLPAWAVGEAVGVMQRTHEYATAPTIAALRERAQRAMRDRIQATRPAPQAEPLEVVAEAKLKLDAIADAGWAWCDERRQWVPWRAAKLLPRAANPVPVTIREIRAAYDDLQSKKRPTLDPAPIALIQRKARAKAAKEAAKEAERAAKRQRRLAARSDSVAETVLSEIFD